MKTINFGEIERHTYGNFGIYEQKLKNKNQGFCLSCLGHTLLIDPEGLDSTGGMKSLCISEGIYYALTHDERTCRAIAAAIKSYVTDIKHYKEYPNQGFNGDNEYFPTKGHEKGFYQSVFGEKNNYSSYIEIANNYGKYTICFAFED